MSPSSRWRRQRPHTRGRCSREAAGTEEPAYRRAGFAGTARNRAAFARSASYRQWPVPLRPAKPRPGRPVLRPLDGSSPLRTSAGSPGWPGPLPARHRDRDAGYRANPRRAMPGTSAIGTAPTSTADFQRLSSRGTRTRDQRTIWPPASGRASARLLASPLPDALSTSIMRAALVCV
jgi:hypothetical protein